MMSKPDPDMRPVSTGPCSRIVIYCKNIDAMVQFYADHFGYHADQKDGDRIVELTPAHGGLILMLHPASKGQRAGQSLIKLVFDVRDVEHTRSQLIGRGIKVGSLHQADGYGFANMKDPAGNSVSISSRAFSEL